MAPARRKRALALVFVTGKFADTAPEIVNALARFGRQAKHVQGPLCLGFGRLDHRGFFDDQVRVGAAEPERTDARYAFRFAGRPG